MVLDIREPAIDEQARSCELFGVNLRYGLCYLILLAFRQWADVLDLVIWHLDSIKQVIILMNVFQVKLMEGFDIRGRDASTVGHVPRL